MMRLLITILSTLTLMACDSRPTPNYQGTLYFGQGAYVMGFGLHNRELSLVGRIGDSTIRKIAAMGPEYLLITESAIVNRTRVSRISWYNLRTGETADLYQGVIASYLAQPGIVVYDTGRSLYAVPRHENTENRVVYTHPNDPITALLETQPGTLLFETGQGAEATIHSWNAATGELEPLDSLTATCRLDGAVWIGPLERLACRPRTGDGTAYVSSHLDGAADGPINLPEGKRFEALTFIESQHILVLRETWRGRMSNRDHHAVWVYDIRDGSSHRLAGDVDLGQSVVFAEY